MQLIVIDRGSPDCGISETYYEVECPFTDPDDKDVLAWFKSRILSAYSAFANGKITAYYDHERKF